MTLASRNPQMLNSNNAAFQYNTLQSTPRTCSRIMVFLDGSPTAEIAIVHATRLAYEHNASLVLVCRSHAGVEDYIRSKTNSLIAQGFDANGYIITDKMVSPAVWLVNSEKADVVVMVQKTASWPLRMLTGNAGQSLEAATGATVISIDI